jgi:hypothetical protein
MSSTHVAIVEARWPAQAADNRSPKDDKKPRGIFGGLARNEIAAYRAERNLAIIGGLIAALAVMTLFPQTIMSLPHPIRYGVK